MSWRLHAGLGSLAGAATVSLAVLLACGGAPPPGGGKSTTVTHTAANEGGCSQDSDCKGDRGCVKGKCVDTKLLRAMKRGEVGIRVVKAATQECKKIKGLLPKISSLTSIDERMEFGKKLQEEDEKLSTARSAYGQWLLAVGVYTKKCQVEADLASIVEGAGPVSEDEVDKAVKNADCRALQAMDQLSLLPFRERFAEEVMKRSFADAEITRRLWIDTLNEYETNCNKRLSRRETAALGATREKLNRIIGLDDETLIRLRSSLLTAMEKGDANSVLSYSRAVSEREKVLDSMHAAEYDARLKSIEQNVDKLASNTKQASKSGGGGGQARPATAKQGSGGGTTLQDVNNTINTVNNAVNTTKSAVDTTKAVMGLFGF